MKTFLATLLSLSALSAQAQTVKVSCKFDDYQLLTKAMESFEVLEGASKRASVLALLQEEMGPVCNQLVPTQVPVTIPGDKSAYYELIGSGNRHFKITITKSLEMNRTAVWIR